MTKQPLKPLPQIWVVATRTRAGTHPAGLAEDPPRRIGLWDLRLRSCETLRAAQELHAAAFGEAGCTDRALIEVEPVTDMFGNHTTRTRILDGSSEAWRAEADMLCTSALFMTGDPRAVPA